MENPILSIQVKLRRILSRECRKAKEAIKDITKAYIGVDGFTVILLELALHRYSESMAEDIRKLIVSGIHCSILTTLNHYSSDFTEKTGGTIKESELRNLESELLTRFATDSYLGATFDNRFDRHKRRLRIKISEQLQFHIGQSVKELNKALFRRFFFSGPMPGGTFYGGIENLMVAEECRLYHEAALTIFRYLGVKYVRFTITPQHHSKDICDLLAHNVDPIVAKELKGKGINPIGVYKLDEFPEHPHPRALYYLEPIYKLGFSPKTGLTI